jgi:hypothetical protein
MVPGERRWLCEPQVVLGEGMVVPVGLVGGTSALIFKSAFNDAGRF